MAFLLFFRMMNRKRLKVMKFKQSDYGRYAELMFLDYADSTVMPVENLRVMSIKIQRFCPPLAFREFGTLKILCDIFYSYWELKFQSWWDFSCLRIWISRLQRKFLRKNGKRAISPSWWKNLSTTPTVISKWCWHALLFNMIVISIIID